MLRSTILSIAFLAAASSAFATAGEPASPAPPKKEEVKIVEVSRGFYVPLVAPWQKSPTAAAKSRLVDGAFILRANELLYYDQPQLLAAHSKLAGAPESGALGFGGYVEAFCFANEFKHPPLYTALSPPGPH